MNLIGSTYTCMLFPRALPRTQEGSFPRLLSANRRDWSRGHRCDGYFRHLCEVSTCSSLDPMKDSRGVGDQCDDNLLFTFGWAQETNAGLLDESPVSISPGSLCAPIEPESGSDHQTPPCRHDNQKYRLKPIKMQSSPISQDFTCKRRVITQVASSRYNELLCNDRK